MTKQVQGNEKNLEPALRLVDSHCHLDFPVFDECRTSLIDECIKKGIHQFIVPGVTAGTWHRLQNISAQFPSIFPAYGLHPYFIDEHKLEHVDKLKQFLLKQSPLKKRPVAVGEIGLDYFLPNLDKQNQQTLFDAQLTVANELNLPVILHVRKAHDDVLMHLKKHRLIGGGSVHAFNGSLQQAHRYIDLGFKLGFGGALTFNRATHLRKLVSQLPLNAILLETDSPDMPPAHFSQALPQKPNSPLTVLAVLQTINALRPEDCDVIAMQTTNNVATVFSI